VIGARLLTAATLLLASAAAVRGGGPLVVATDGRPVGWDPTRPLAYEVDRGALGALDNTAATALVERLLGTWRDVPTATIDFVRTGLAARDVDGTNFGPFLGPYAGATVPSGRTVVVFDADGTIFDTLFGLGTGVLGFAGPTFFSDGTTTVAIGDAVPPAAQVIEGLAFLNGKWIDGVHTPAAGNFELPLARFEPVVVHELGHLCGLGHTQVHGLYGPPESDSPIRTTPVETMFPFAVDATQVTLEQDDVVALSALYPTPDFAAATGRITGRVLTSEGVPFSGANVVARNVADGADAVSVVSGTVGRPGEFAVAGLRPGASYTVEIQEVDAFHTGGSRVGPFSPPVPLPGPAEFYNGPDESADPATDDPRARALVTAAAGATAAGVDLALNRQRFTVTNVALEPGSQPNGFVVADFDQDGVADFVTTQFGFMPGNLIRFHRGLGGGVFALPVTVASFPGNAHVVAAHLDRGVDDLLDLAVASTSRNEVRVYRGTGAGTFGPPVTVVDAPDVGPLLHGLVAGDLDGDPFPDLVILIENADGSATVHALRGSAAGDFTVVRTTLAAGSGFPVGGLTLGDFAGSPAADVIGIAADGGASGPPALGLLVGDGPGGFTVVRSALGFTNAVDRGALGTGDFDEDGILDVVVSDLFPVGGPNNWTRSFVDLLRGDGAGGFTLAARYAVPEVSQSGLATADVDGDGHLDVASTGARFERGSPGASVTVGFGDGTGGIRRVETVWGLAEFPSRIVAANLDGDGRPDLLVNDGEASVFGLEHAPAYSVLVQAAAPSPPSPTTSTRPPTTSSSSTSSTTSTSTTSTSSSTSSTLPALVASGDTYVEAGTQATWDHGAADHLDTDLSRARIAYLRFDLRAVAGPVARATLVLTCLNASDDGGTVYPVADASWVEGTRTGADGTSAGGPGLTWAQVDTNRDGRIDARDAAPWVPDFTRPLGTLGRVAVGQTRSVDVTAAFQKGPGLYALAIRSGSTDKASWAAREAAASASRPRLLLVVGAADSVTTSTTTSTSTTTTTLPAPAVLAPLADTYVTTGTEASTDHGTCTTLETDLSPVSVSYLKFDLRSVPGPVARATLELTCTNGSADGGTIYPVADSSWLEGTRCDGSGTGLRWAQVDCNRDGRVDAADAGPACPYAPDLARPIAVLGPVTAGVRVSVDVTAAFQSGPGLYTLAVRNASTDGADYASRENGTTSRRPRLRLELRPQVN
jgi:hypothetical protein